MTKVQRQDSDPAVCYVALIVTNLYAISWEDGREGERKVRHEAKRKEKQKSPVRIMTLTLKMSFFTAFLVMRVLVEVSQVCSWWAVLSQLNVDRGPFVCMLRNLTQGMRQ